MSNFLKRQIYANIWWLSILLTLGLVIVDWNCPKTPLIEYLIGLFGIVFVIQKQKTEEVQIFFDLFKRFNERYDKLNESLYRISQGNKDDTSVWKTGDQELTEEYHNIVIDYFNLCAEEYLAYKEGLILEEVWKAWENGMKIYFREDWAQRIWEQEKSSNSYYGFQPPIET